MIMSIFSNHNGRWNDFRVRWCLSSFFNGALHISYGINPLDEVICSRMSYDAWRPFADECFYVVDNIPCRRSWMCFTFTLRSFSISASYSPLRIEALIIVIFFLTVLLCFVVFPCFAFHLVFILVSRYLIFGCLFFYCHFHWSSFRWILGGLQVSCYGNCCAQLAYSRRMSSRLITLIVYVMLGAVIARPI